MSESNLHQRQLPLFLVNLIQRSPVSAQDQMSSRPFFNCEMCTRGSSPWSLASIWLVRRFSCKEIQGKSFLVITNPKNGRKLEALVWRAVDRHLRNLEEFRTQSSHRYITKPQRQTTWPEFHIDKNANTIFLSTITSNFFFFLQKIITVKLVCLH